MISWIIVPQDIYIEIPRICEYINVKGEKDLKDSIDYVKAFEKDSLPDHPDRLKVITEGHYNKKQRSSESEITEAEVKWCYLWSQRCMCSFEAGWSKDQQEQPDQLFDTSLVRHDFRVPISNTSNGK